MEKPFNIPRNYSNYFFACDDGDINKYERVRATKQEGGVGKWIVGPQQNQPGNKLAMAWINWKLVWDNGYLEMGASQLVSFDNNHETT